MSITNNTIISNKIKEMVLAELRSVKAIQTDYAKVIDAMETHLEAYKKSKGTPAEKEHIQKLKTLTSQKKKLADELNAKVSDMYKDAELKVDEMNTTGNVAGYNTPFAFSGKDSEEKKGKRQADLTGYSVVNESHFKVGDKVKMSHGGIGVIKSLDKEHGADDEKYYSVQLPNGETHKHSPNELSSVNEAIQNAPAKNGKELADFILRHYDFATDYIDDGGDRRRAIKSNDDIVEWFDSHPIDLKKEAFKILQSKIGSLGKSQLQRVFGKSTTDK